ncbi:MAG: hypothetical protein DMG50_01380 [Acidobacteria bacterium]|nr:MAG: hypothetical protein DMG50_01380 [Acidobacteriota bacterium]
MYTIRQARKNFSMLLRKAVRGEEVIIARGRTPVAKLVTVELLALSLLARAPQPVIPHPTPSLKIG